MEKRFDRALVESVEETVTTVLGKKVAESFYSYLYENLGLSAEDIPSHPEELSSTLEEALGVGGRVLSNAIARKLCTKLGLSFVKKSDSSFVECIEALKKILLKEQTQIG